MDKDSYLIAVASSDGIVVNSHFGKARKFFIYEVSDEGEIHLVEQKEVTPVCESGNHDDQKLKEALERLSGCRYILVSRIGNSAAAMAESFGIEAMELPGEIGESIQRLIQFRKIQNLFA